MNIYSLHDLGGQHLMDRAGAKGWIVISESLKGWETNLEALRQGEAGQHRVIARLNWSHHGEGTIPRTASDLVEFRRLVKQYAERAQGLVHGFIIGNEPNHPQEWGSGNPITPSEYAYTYNTVVPHIRAVSPDYRVGPAAVAPWPDKARYVGNENGDWVRYFSDLVRELNPDLVDVWPMHAYSNGEKIEPRQMTEGPFAGRDYGFSQFMEFVDKIPDHLERPIWLTEMNMNQDWPAHRTHWFKDVYFAIHDYNRQESPKIEFGAVYRWQTHDKFGIADKPAMQESFEEACRVGYQSPQDVPEAPKKSGGSNTYLPLVEDHQGAPDLPGGFEDTEWDPALDLPAGRPRAILRRAEEVFPGQVRKGAQVWRLVAADWQDDQEGGGKTNIFFRALDQSGKQVGGVEFKRWWDGSIPEVKESRETGWSDFPMWNLAPAYSVAVGERGVFSDEVRGMGLGSIERPDYTHHAVYYLTYQLQEAGEVEEPVEVPTLVHPVLNPNHRMVSQTFGGNPDFYRQFVYDGVPLKGHNGVDFIVPEGEEIVAVDDGIVSKVESEEGGFGLHVKVDHDWGSSLYAHLSRTPLKVGQAVAPGQTIGLSGNTGASSGPHLHFGIQPLPVNRKDGWGGYRDPLAYLANQGNAPVHDVELFTLIVNVAREFGIDPAMFLAMVWNENRFTTKTSPIGAMGLAQIMPATWAEWAPRVGATDPMEPRDNLRVAAAYLDWCIDQAGNLRKGLIAYNWGIGNLMKRPNEVPLETLIYAHSIELAGGLLNRLDYIG